MAIKCINSKWCSASDDYRKEFICDTDADFTSLPKCCTGSNAVSIASGKVYAVNASGEWVEFGAEG